MTDWEEALNIISDYLEANAKRPEIAYLCKDKGTEYCHHTTHIEHARNFEMVCANVWMEKEPPTATLEPYEDDDYSGGGYLMCTKCNWRFSFGAYRILQDDNYCPHCGSKIKKEGEAE